MYLWMAESAWYEGLERVWENGAWDEFRMFSPGGALWDLDMWELMGSRSSMSMFSASMDCSMSRWEAAVGNCGMLWVDCRGGPNGSSGRLHWCQALRPR